MMKMMKSKMFCIVAITLIVTILFLPFGTLAKADESDYLIEIGGKKITKDMSVEDVEGLFGFKEPIIQTPSIFGGSAYTFYNDNYSDYLYLETNENGTIMCYGTISPDFKTPTYSYGDVLDSKTRYGTEVTYGGKLAAVVRYTSFGNTSFTDIFANNDVYSKSLCMHATEMFNAVLAMRGKSERLIFDERTYEINQQLADNYSDLYDYCNNTDQSSLCALMTSAVDFFVETYSRPNPLQFARFAFDYDVHDGYYSAFIWRKWTETGGVGYLAASLSPDFFAERQKVDYTDEEKQLLKEAREHYMRCVELNNSFDDQSYEVEPQYKELPLVAGVAKENAVKAGVEYLNAIRVGAGIKPVEYSQTLTEGAQHKATLTMYINQNGIDNPNPHYPSQPEGVDDSFYEKSCIGATGDRGENLYYGNFITSISHALADTAALSCGHRYTLLDPTIAEIGIGVTGSGLLGGQGCHKVGGYQTSDVEVAAWPSKGITPIESLISGDIELTCEFFNGLQVTSDTGVIVKCLNNGSVWIIDPSNLAEGQDIKVISNIRIGYKDETITFNPENVYEITFMGLTDKTTGELTTYSYRSVIEHAYVDESDDQNPEELTLSDDTLTLCVGKIAKIKATITPVEAKNKLVTWNSTDENIASVNRAGVITAKTAGTVTITATTSNGISKTVELTIKDHEYGDWTVTKVPTCTEKGTREKVCAICGDTITEELSATGHQWNAEFTTDKSATCTEEGSESIHCSSCDEIKEGSSRVIAKTEHTYGDWKITKTATCTEKGSREKICSGCGDKVIEEIPALGHSWNENYMVDKEPTCTEEGSESIHCSSCDEIKEGSSRVIAKTEHTYGDWKITKTATCTEKGSREKICSECGDIVTEEISARGHSWNENYTVDKEPTCTEEGSESIHCSVCEAIKEGTQTVVPKADHVYGDWKTTVAPACTETGVREKKCTVCGDTITEELPATGHQWNDDYTVDKPATHSEEGEESIHCSVCDEIKEGSARTIPVTEHVFGEWITTIPATCTEDGEKVQECTDCGFKETVVIPATGHHWNSDYTVDKEPSCTEEGVESIHCSVCDETKEGSSKTIAKTEHTYGDWTITKKPTYTEVGTREHKCTDCGHTEQAEIPILEKKGWVKEDGYWYYYNADGTKAVSTWKKDSKGWCYLGADGKMVTNGWAKDSKGWCWMSADGYWVKNKWIQYKGEWYYIKANGYMAAKEWAKDSKGWMYMDASGKITKNKWIKSGGYWYYLKANGYMATGTQTIGGKTYKFDSSGRWIS